MRDISETSVAVVGGAGFLGSHLVNYLIDERDCRVTVIDNLVVGKREFVHPKAYFVHHDITASESRLKNILEQNGVQYVFNYAAYPYIPDSFARPIHVCDVNFLGAAKVINAATEAGCKGILQVSSAEIYGGSDTEPEEVTKLDESAKVNPHSSYGVSKAAVDSMVQVRWKENKTPCIALRQFNCVGERETHPYIVPEIISQLYPQRHQAEAEVYLGNNSTRDFLYAGDAVRMAVELLEKGQFGEVYNLGSESSIKMYDLAEMIGKVLFINILNRPSMHLQIYQDPKRIRPWEIWHLQSDNSKIYSVIESRPEVSLFEAIRKTITYYAEHQKWGWE